MTGSTNYTVTIKTYQSKDCPRNLQQKYQPSLDRDVLEVMKLKWWRIQGYQEDRGTKDKFYEAKRWHGLTITGLSPYEDSVIISWISSQDPKSCYMSKRDWCGGELWTEYFIGDYDDFDYNIWLKSPSKIKEINSILESFPKRNKVLLGDPGFSCFDTMNMKVLRGSKQTAYACFISNF